MQEGTTICVYCSVISVSGVSCSGISVYLGTTLCIFQVFSPYGIVVYCIFASIYFLLPSSMGSITSHPQPSPIQDLIANGHLAPAPKQQRRQSLSKNNKNTEEECPICFTSVRQSELNITQCCNHKICTNCFTTLNYTRSQDSWIAT